MLLGEQGLVRSVSLRIARAVQRNPVYKKQNKTIKIQKPTKLKQNKKWESCRNSSNICDDNAEGKTVLRSVKVELGLQLVRCLPRISSPGFEKPGKKHICDPDSDIHCNLSQHWESGGRMIRLWLEFRASQFKAAFFSLSPPPPQFTQVILKESNLAFFPLFFLLSGFFETGFWNCTAILEL